eukprot:jgi/Chlat1/3205/Chrsp22S03485
MLHRATFHCYGRGSTHIASGSVARKRGGGGNGDAHLIGDIGYGEGSGALSVPLSSLSSPTRRGASSQVIITAAAQAAGKLEGAMGEEEAEGEGEDVERGMGGIADKGGEDNGIGGGGQQEHAKQQEAADAAQPAEPGREPAPKLKLEVLTQAQLDAFSWAMLVATVIIAISVVSTALVKLEFYMTPMGYPTLWFSIFGLALFDVLFLISLTLICVYCWRCLYQQPWHEWDREQVWTVCMLFTYMLAVAPIVRIWMYAHGLEIRPFFFSVINITSSISLANYYAWCACVVHSYRIVTPKLPTTFYVDKAVFMVLYVTARVLLLERFPFTTHPAPMVSVIAAVRVLVHASPPIKACTGQLILSACDFLLYMYVACHIYKTAKAVQLFPISKYRRQRLSHKFFVFSIAVIWALSISGGALAMLIKPISEFYTPGVAMANFAGTSFPLLLVIIGSGAMVFVQAYVRLPANAGFFRTRCDISPESTAFVKYDLYEPPCGERSTEPVFALNTCALCLSTSILAYRSPLQVHSILSSSSSSQQAAMDAHGSVDSDQLQFVGRAVGVMHTTAYVFTTSDFIVVAFRGTASLSGVRADLFFPLVPMDACYMHLKRSSTKDARSDTEAHLKTDKPHALHATSSAVELVVESPSVSQPSVSTRLTRLPASPSTAEDLVDLASTSFTPTGPSGSVKKVHTGFYSCWRSVACQVVSLVEKARSGGSAGKRLLICGHSLGGALAMLCAYDMTTVLGLAPADVTVYTFGSPRLGNHAFAVNYESKVPRTFRVVLVRDMVAKLPPPWRSLFGFKHAGQLVLLDRHAGMLLNPSFADRIMLHGLQVGSLQRHLASSYVKALDRWRRREHGDDKQFSFPFPWNGQAVPPSASISAASSRQMHNVDSLSSIMPDEVKDGALTAEPTTTVWVQLTNDLRDALHGCAAPIAKCTRTSVHGGGS